MSKKIIKDNACIKCNNVINDNVPFISRGGDTYCIVCHHFLCEKERQREIEIIDVVAHDN